jgi:NitT/TauT family transport system substrate-binding protein
MAAITNMIRKHIPEHNEQAIIESLRPDLNVINYRHLNVDKAGLKQIMDLAVEGGILREPIDIDAFADENFATEITDQ